MARIAVLAHGAFDPSSAKTGNSLIKYARDGWSGDEVVCVVDRTKAGRDAGDLVGAHAAGIPVVASAKDAARFRPDVLAIGIAPVGGALPDDWRADLRDALAGGMDLLSGLHLFLGDDPELAALAQANGRTIRDVRKPTRPRRIATGAGALVDAVVVTHVGTDCSSGKMTTAIELTREARRRGLRAAFVATGQTGIMVGATSGAPLDAITSDFVAGAMEECVLEAAASGADLVFVEGQGALNHPAYSGVTVSLLHGSFPDLLVLCGEPRRRVYKFPCAYPFPLNSFAEEKRLNEAMCASLTGATVAACGLMTRGLTDAELAEEVRRVEAETGAPASDVFRGGAPKLLDGVLRAAEANGLWKDDRYVGDKRARARGAGVRRWS